MHSPLISAHTVSHGRCLNKQPSLLASSRAFRNDGANGTLPVLNPAELHQLQVCGGGVCVWERHIARKCSSNAILNVPIVQMVSGSWLEEQS